MRSDAWPRHCRAALVEAASAAAAKFPGPGEENPARVHDVRRRLKEARAVARLFLRSIGEPARAVIASLAAARRQIGRARDLDVMAVRLQRLAPPAEALDPLMAAIEADRQAARRARRGLSANAPRARMKAMVKRLEAWDVNSMGTEDIVAAVKRTYRQARRRGRIAFDSHDQALLHALRSRVVDLRYQLALLSPAWPEAINAQGEELNALRDTLGAFNDLRVLASFATDRCALSGEAHGRLMQAIEAKQKKLRKRAKTEFDRLFAETPDAFAARLTAYLARPMEKPDENATERAPGA